MAGFFGMFDYTKPGKGVNKEDLDKTGLELFFDILGRRFGKLVILNILYVLASLPAILISWSISAFATVSLAELAQVKITAQNSASFSLLSILMTVILLQLGGTGAASVSMSYVLRKYTNDMHSWVWSDFWENLKSNFVQGTIAYVINLVVITSGITGIVLYPVIIPGYMGFFVRTMLIIFMAVFLMMQMYVYQMISGFDLKIKDIYKNAALLVVAKLPWNVFTAAVSGLFIYAFGMLAQKMPLIAILIVVFFFFSITAFTQIFMTNNIVKKYLVSPADEKSAASEDKN